MKPEEIPGLAQYLPAHKHWEPGYCKDCGKKLSTDEYDPELVKQGYWQPDYCNACMDKLEV